MTVMVARSNRYGAEVVLDSAASSVALDAQVNEYGELPVGYGHVLMRTVHMAITGLSGAYVAPVPPYDGTLFYITDGSGSATVDRVASGRFVHHNEGTQANLNVTIELMHYRLLRLGERLYATAPIIAGAGVTGTVTIGIMGLRINTA